MTTAGAAQPVRDIDARIAWIVCGLLFAAIVALVFLSPDLLSGPGRTTEQGLLEQGQNLILAIALVLAVTTLLAADTRYLRVWLALIILGLVYLLGEEISWGQHYFNWETGGFFADINDQGETNFHNTAGGWLDQKPRAILLFGMLMGVVVHPLVRWARKGRGLFDHPWWLAPTLASLPPFVFSQLGALPKRLDSLHVLNWLPYVRWSEVEEVFMYLFFVTYLLSLRTRLMQRKRLGLAPAA